MKRNDNMKIELRNGTTIEAVGTTGIVIRHRGERAYIREATLKAIIGWCGRARYESNNELLSWLTVHNIANWILFGGKEWKNENEK